MNRRKNSTRWSVLIFGIFMSFIMVGSLATGWLLQVAQQRDFTRQQQAALEPTAIPTFEPPVSVNLVSFEEEPALQANGVFTMPVPNPPTFDAVESSFDSFANRARLLMRSGTTVVEATAENPAIPISTVEELNTLYTPQLLGASWRNYTNWREIERRTVSNEAGQDYLQIDFEVDFQNRTFVARQQSWAADGKVYSVRVITPENATDLLVYLLDELVAGYSVIDTFAGVPVSWNAYYDDARSHIIRYPQNWTLTDAADGVPASIESQNVALRVEAVEMDAIEDTAAAEAYVADLPYVREVLASTETTRGDLSGFVVSYQSRSLDGEIGSGQVVLLNGDDVVHMANLRVNALDVDLNALGDDAPEGASEYALVMESFVPLSGVTLAAATGSSAAPIVENTQQQTQPNIGF